MKVAYGSFRDWQYAMGRASAFGKPSCLMLGDVGNNVCSDFLLLAICNLIYSV